MDLAPPAIEPPASAVPSNNFMNEMTPIPERRAIAVARAEAAVDKAVEVLRSCTLANAAKFLGQQESARDIAAAAMELCQAELDATTRAMQDEVALEMWFQGPPPLPSVSIDREFERTFANKIMPKFAALIMQARARIESQRESRSAAQAPDKAESGETSGTAFFVSHEGKALTNAHVVSGCQQIRVKGGTQSGTAQIIATDKDNDLALLSTDLHPSEIADWRLSIRQGEHIVIYGFPLLGVLSSTGNVAEGSVTALAGLNDDSRFLQISAPVQPGNSGSAVFDQSGRVVGIVDAKLDALKVAAALGDIPQNINFAIKGSVAAAFLDVHHVIHTDGSDGPLLSTPDLVDRAKSLTMQVVCIP
jgi:S1-C subfamily serine protease